MLGVHFPLTFFANSFYTASAEDCPLAKLIESLYWRKQTLKSHFLAAETDPQRTLDGIISKAENGTLLPFNSF
jgi:hypothetical protein